ncbi:hypothetical protein Patl1_08091 [Pistacia atlantica]|nr:hypothetical protein Patl1_08091 [Pistacia atlantica]
MIKLST